MLTKNIDVCEILAFEGNKNHSHTSIWVMSFAHRDIFLLIAIVLLVR